MTNKPIFNTEELNRIAEMFADVESIDEFIAHSLHYLAKRDEQAAESLSSIHEGLKGNKNED